HHLEYNVEVVAAPVANALQVDVSGYGCRVSRHYARIINADPGRVGILFKVGLTQIYHQVLLANGHVPLKGPLVAPIVKLQLNVAAVDFLIVTFRDEAVAGKLVAPARIKGTRVQQHERIL